MEISTAIGATAEYAVTLVAMAVGFLVVAYLYDPYWKVRHVPGPVPLPLIGHLHLLLMHGPDVFSVLAKKYGPVFRFHMGRQPLVMVADAELCKEVGVKKFKNFPNRSMPSPITNSPVHQKGLFFTSTLVNKGSKWTAMRNMIISVYQPSHLATLIPIMESCIERAAENLDGQEEINFSKLSLRFTTDVLGQAAFGTDFGLSKKSASSDDDHTHKIAADTSADAKASSEFMRMHVHATTSLKMDMSGSLSIIVGQLVPFLHEPFRQVFKRIPWTADHEIDRVNLTLGRQMDRIVAERAAAMKRNPAALQQRNDFLSVILTARESNESARELLTPDHISALTYEHLLAGSATTAFTLCTVLYLVAKHPEVEEKLLREIDGFGPRDHVPTAEDLRTKFPYLDQVVKESMRVYPSSPLIARELNEQLEIGGYALPKGTRVWMAPGVLAKDPMNFPEPKVFRPERFEPNGEEEKRRHPYALFPFGIGPRVCIGQKFAMQEIKLSAIHFYRHYVFRPSPNMESPPEFVYSIVSNFKNGVKLQVIKRHNA